MTLSLLYLSISYLLFLRTGSAEALSPEKDQAIGDLPRLYHSGEFEYQDIYLTAYLTNPARYLNKARADFNALSDPGSRRYFDLSLALTRIHLDLNQVDEARTYFERIEKRVLDSDSQTDRAIIIYMRSLFLSKALQFKESTQLLHENQDLVPKSNLKLSVSWKNRQVASLSSIGKVAESIAQHESLFAYLKENPFPVQEAYIRLMYVSKLLHAGFYDLAEAAISDASVAAQSLDNVDVLRYLNLTRARYYLRKSLYEKALASYYQELRWAERHKSERDLAFVYMALAIIYHDTGNTAKAEKYYLQAKEVYDKLGDKEGRVAVLINLAVFNMNEDRYTVAEEYYLEMLAISESFDSSYYKSFSLVGLSDVYLKMKKEDLALKYLNQARELVESDPRPATKMSFYTNLAEAYYLKGQFDKAEAELLFGLDLARDHENVHFERVAIKDLINLYETTEEWEKAFNYQQQLAEITQKVNDASKAEAMAEVSARYEEDKKAQKIEILRKENALKELELSQQESERALVAILVLSLMVAIITLVVRYFNRETKRKVRLFIKAFDISAEAMWVATPDLKIVFANPALSKISGVDEEKLIGRKLRLYETEEQNETLLNKIVEIARQEGRWKGELFDKRKDGTVYPIDFQIQPIFDENKELTHYFGIFEDITERHQARKELEHLATHDALTDIPNRSLFAELLHQSCERSRQTDLCPAVLFIDLDNFKTINDSFGHEVGDQLLIAVCEKLMALKEENTVIARIGGDEFCAFITDANPSEEAAHLAKRIKAALDSPIQVNSREFTLTASIGIAVYPKDGHTPTALMRNADIAMYAVKEQNKNGFHFYQTGMNERILAELELEDRIKKSLDAGDFELHFQPRIDIQSSQVVGGEALIRWREADGTLIYPDQFIPVAEKSGLIIAIDCYVIEKALQQLHHWLSEGLDPGKLSINLSAAHFGQPDSLLPFLESTLRRFDVPVEHLEIEITEGMLLENVDKAITTMNAIRSLGLTLAVDDFGTGYSSLSYIQRFPLNVLKVDRTFIWKMHESSRDQSVTRAVVELAHSLSLGVVAEGVEAEAHLDVLKRMGCNEYQGYFFSRPLPAEQFEKFLGKETAHSG